MFKVTSLLPDTFRGVSREGDVVAIKADWPGYLIFNKFIKGNI